ncbi:MAG: hypothetical protein WB821_08245 [Burkholderiaceae bacterium]
MSSIFKLQDIVQTVRHTTQDISPNLDAVRASIYDVVMHAFMSEVLTLGRMNGVIRAVRKGVDDSKSTASDAATNTLTLTQLGAYRGLCRAADEGLTAVGLAYTDLLKFHGLSLSTDFEKLLLHETFRLKQQLEQVTFCADWHSNSQVTGLQSHWFAQLSVPLTPDFRAQEASVMPWSARFFQLCGYEPSMGKSDPHASLMLLGLFTSGVLTGLRSAQREV